MLTLVLAYILLDGVYLWKAEWAYIHLVYGLVSGKDLGKIESVKRYVSVNLG